MAGELNKLSDRKLKGLHGIPASKIEFYADGAGLSAKVTKAGGISWVFTYRLDGQKLHRLTLGRYPDMSLKEARSRVINVASGWPQVKTQSTSWR